MRKRKTIHVILYFLLGLVLLLLFVLFVLLTSADRQILFSRTQQLTHDGMDRHYRIHSPKSSAEPRRLILAFHGFSGNSQQVAYYTALHNSTDQNTVVVYPEASPPKSNQKTGWNAGFCCGSGWANGVDDVGFIEKLIDELVKSENIDPAQVYAVGFSNGGMFTHHLAESLPDKLAGFAAAAGVAGTTKKQIEPKKTVPALLMHGKKDTIVPFNGGVGTTDPDFTWIDFKSSVEIWMAANGCQREQTAEQNGATITTFEECQAPLVTYAFAEDGHRWHDWRLFRVWHKQTEASRLVLQFFDSIKNDL